MAGRWVSIVPTFRPLPETVELVRTLAACGPVVVSDDGSPCTSDAVLAAIDSIPGVQVIRNGRNRGIGRALNQGLSIAQETGCRWLLTVDQDSSVDIGYAPSMVAYADELDARGVRLGAVGAGAVRDASGPLVYPTRAVVVSGVEMTVTEELVQSGTLWSVEALTALGGFDESLGMDAVDAAACLGLRVKGLQIVVDPSSGLDHRIEGARQVTILGRRLMITGHSSARRRAMVRNRLRLLPREFDESPRHAVRTIRRSLINYLAYPLRKRS